MKISLLAIPLLLLATMAGAEKPTDPKRDFAWEIPLDSSFEANTLYRSKIPNDVFDGSSRFPNDLRVIDGQGANWPFFIWRATGSSQFSARQFSKLNESVVEADVPYLRVELKLNGARAMHNRIELDTAGSDFIRRVEIFGSADQKSWGKIAEGYLFDHQRPDPIRSSRIRYPNSDLPFIQIRIFPNARNSDETVKLGTVLIGRGVSVPSEWENVPVDVTPVTEEEDKPWQSLILDSGFKNRPLEQITFDIETPAFARQLRLFGRASSSNEWAHIRTGAIHRMGSEKLNLDLSGKAWQQIKVQLYHYDDEPLKVNGITAKAITRYMAFEALSNESASLFFGNPDLTLPRFDLEQRTPGKEAAKAPLVPTGARVANKEFKPHPSRKWMPLITGVGIATVSIIIIWVIASMLRQGGALDSEKT